VSHHYLPAAAAWVLLAGAATAEPPKFAITLVDALPGQADNCLPSGINDADQIVGLSQTASPSQLRPFTWSVAEGMRTLVEGPNGIGEARDINNLGGSHRRLEAPGSSTQARSLWVRLCLASGALFC